MVSMSLSDRSLIETTWRVAGSAFEAILDGIGPPVCCFRTPAQASNYPSGRFPGRERKRLSLGCSLKRHRIGADGGGGKGRAARSTWDCHSGRGVDPRQPVERALQDKGGCVLIDHRRAFFPADVHFDQVTLDCGRG